MDLITVLKALSNEKRLQILDWLKDPKKNFKTAQCDVSVEGVCVGLIEEKIGLSQSTVSQYLMQLKQAGLITMHRKGQWTYYKRNEKTIKDLIKELEKI